jgi:hypothetical protein
MTPVPVTLTRYLGYVDNGEFDRAMALFVPDVHFAIVLPTGTMRGDKRSDFVDYLKSRGQVARRHLPYYTAASDNVEFVYGDVVDNGTETIGRFLGAGRLNDEGLIATYQVTFEPYLDLFSRG